jgi:hypothetical protein
LLLYTNGYRDEFRTGAASRETEALIIYRNELQIPQQLTTDIIKFPLQLEILESSCVSLAEQTICTSNLTAASNGSMNGFGARRLTQSGDSTGRIFEVRKLLETNDTRRSNTSVIEEKVCPQYRIPRPILGTESPTEVKSASPASIASPVIFSGEMLFLVHL